MTGAPKPVVTKEDGVWIVRLRSFKGTVQEYRCTSERQARQLALVLTPREMYSQAWADAR